MYSGRQSDQGVGANLMATVCPSANISKEYLETNWNNVTMDQKIGSNGPYGFPSYSLELDEKQGLYNPSTVCPDFQTNNEHSGNTSAKEKKRKGKAECDAMQNPSPRNRVQMEAQSKSMGNSVEKDEKKISPKMQSKEDSSDGDDPKGEYVHVRAKRGQATNSHSLAERMRRKKISERMKLLQDLVPGCSKITGKAVMLDEIINYVQSLQRQVEFLSMKLAAVNPELSFDLEQILSKEILLSQDRHLAFYGTDQGSSSLLGQFNQGSMQSEMLCSVSNPADTLPTTIHDISPMSQMPAMWDGLQNVAHMEFAPGMAADSTNNAESMKMEQ